MNENPRFTNRSSQNASSRSTGCSALLSVCCSHYPHRQEIPCTICSGVPFRIALASGARTTTALRKHPASACRSALVAMTIAARTHPASAHPFACSAMTIARSVCRKSVMVRFARTCSVESQVSLAAARVATPCHVMAYVANQAETDLQFETAEKSPDENDESLIDEQQHGNPMRLPPVYVGASDFKLMK